MTQKIALDLALLGMYGEAVQPIANAIIASKAEKAELTEEQKVHNEELKATVADKVRDFAATTAADGVEPEQANAALRTLLTLGGVPKGTALNYGRAVEGFRKIMDVNPEGWRVASVKDAQTAMQTEGQKAKADLREQLKPYLRDATVEQLEAMLEHAQGLNVKLKERKVRTDKGQQETAEASDEVAVAA